MVSSPRAYIVQSLPYSYFVEHQYQVVCKDAEPHPHQDCSHLDFTSLVLLTIEENITKQQGIIYKYFIVTHSFNFHITFI